MKIVKVKDISTQIRGVSYSKGDAISNKKDGYIPLIRTNNIVDGILTNDDILYVSRSIVQEKQIIKAGDIVIAASSGSINIVGKAAYSPENLNSTFGAFCKLIRPNFKHIVPIYMNFYFQSNVYRLKVSSLAQGANINNLKNEHIDELEIPLPPLNEQKRIAEILDKADALRQKNKQLLAAYDDLVQATFLDMFGDPVMNPMGWDIQSLTNFGEFKNGLNYSKSDEGVGIRCLGVGDFKDKSILVDVESISKVYLSDIPKDDYFLKDGDLIFVRSNGNRELVGRCLVIYPGAEKVSYSGFCIRFRVKEDSLNTVYLTHLFRIPSLKNVMLQNGRGANIQNINQNILDNLKIPIPPKEMQDKFFRLVQNIEAQKTLVMQSLRESEDLFNGLVQKAFGCKL